MRARPGHEKSGLTLALPADSVSWIGQTHLDEFFSGSLTQTQVTQQPIIDVESVSDIELDTIELIDSEAVLDVDQP